VIARAAHLGQDLVQPLQGAVEVNFDPAGSRCNVLSVILCAPAFDERHPDRAHLGQLVHSLESVIHALRQQCGELLIIENFETASWGDLADGGRMEAVVVVAVPRLHEDGRVRQALCVHLPTNIVQMHSFTYMSPSIFYCGISVNIGELPEAETIVVLV